MTSFHSLGLTVTVLLTLCWSHGWTHRFILRPSLTQFSWTIFTYFRKSTAVISLFVKASWGVSQRNVMTLSDLLALHTEFSMASGLYLAKNFWGSSSLLTCTRRKYRRE